MTQFLQSLQVTDFRSVCGTIDVRLDAPVVLVHGPNAVGKTSVMSAIELALTGRLDAFSAVGRDYVNYLTHRGKEVAAIRLDAVNEEGDPRSAELFVSDSKVSGNPLLPPAMQRFFSERCYLGQATLSRLLELYQQPSPSQESALTRFVKDLLGVDVLDALVDGLHIAGHVQRIRNAVPEYGAAEASQASTEKAIRDSRGHVSELRAQVTLALESITASLRVLMGAVEPSIVGDPKRMQAIFSFDQESNELTALAVIRPDLHALQKESGAAPPGPVANLLAKGELASERAAAAFEAWSVSDGEVLRKLISRLEKMFSALPDPDSVDPDFALNAAVTVVERELARCEKVVADAALTSKTRERAKHDMKRAQERLRIIESELASRIHQAESLAEALNRLLPHIHSDDCPVCGRDYSDVSTESLVNRVSREVNRLVKDASMARELIVEQRNAREVIDALQAEIAKYTRQLPESKLLNETKRRAADLSESLLELNKLRPSAASGTQLRREVSEKQRDVLLLRKRAREAESLPKRIDSIAIQLDLKLRRSLTNPERLEVLRGHISRRETELRERLRIKEMLQVDYRRLQLLQTEMEATTESLSKSEGSLEALRSQMREHATRRESLKNLSKAAVQARNAVMKTVFTKSLNKLWRDLFVRLAPEEGYVPAFKVPKRADGPLEVRLETVHRLGGSGGPPGSMLSAGNLNTAALTLFLALHLSIEKRLPLLMLDDPVQSMDEVHTVQLAALLRVMSKEKQARQIIIAVHERSLFDYLAFELAPSFPEDRLITVELSRDADGGTVVDNQYHRYREETAVA